MGPPNSGKTTLFNWITGCKRQTVNYPGSTADLSFGLIKGKKNSWTVIDTPGAYGFFSPSPEGETARKALKDSLNNQALRGVLLVLDATRLKRQLPLFFQLKSTGLPLILVLSMYDIQKKESELNLPLLSRLLKVPVCPVEGLLGGGVRELIDQAHTHFSSVADCPLSSFPLSAPPEKKQSSYLNQAHKTVEKVLLKPGKNLVGHKTKSLDSLFLHPVWGFGFLSVILFVFFSAIFWLAQPLMNWVDWGVAWGVQALEQWNGPGADFLSGGVLTGFGSFLIFVPQIFILFSGLCLLEDSGYMARAASLVDGPFSRIGLSGKSLFPFLSGFACAIPATLSARAISSKRERWITIFVLPFMTCSARLPVYALLLSFLFYGDSAWKPGLLMSFLYFLSLFLGAFFAGLMSLFIPKDKKSSFFIELPLYRRPVLRSVLAVSWSRTKHFISKAGPVIFVFSLMMWLATHYPRATDLPPEKQIEQSYAGRFGQWIEPVFEKPGWDWRVGVSLLSAFVAREVFVSVLAVTLKNTKEGESVPAMKDTSLLKTMKTVRRKDHRPLFSTAGVMALLVFFIFSLQCLSTTAIVYKETGSWKWAGAQLASFNLLAYAGAVVTYNIMV